MKSFFFTTIIVLSVITSFKSQTVTYKELLGRPTDNSITIQLFFNDTVEVAVQYGTTSGVYSNQTSWQAFTKNSPVDITLTGLQPNTKYYYCVNYRYPNTTSVTNRPEYTFHTQRPTGSTFSFIVQADPHLDSSSDTALYRRCLKNQLEDNPDFTVDLGDFLMTDKLKNSSNVVPHDTIPYRCQLLRSYYETSGHSVPLFIALGNHEGEAGWYNNGTANNIAVWDSQERKKYFNNPFPNTFYTGDTTHNNYIGQRENYYAWQWGDALFIVLDPYWYTNPKPTATTGWRWTLGKTQYDWLKTTLENSTATYKFVFSHQIIGGDPDGRGGVEFADLYEWGGNNLDGTPGFATNRPGWYKPIKDLLTEHRVSIFFHGHDHFFGKQEKDCLIYQETPQPSLPIFTGTTVASGYGYVSGQILPNTGHLKVTVAPSGVQVDYVRAFTPAQETTNRHNKDISATYFIGPVNCYDTLSSGVPIIWNSNYDDELICPNPFANETKIEFSLTKAEKTNITIFNANGILVNHLLSETVVPKGKFEVIWDGKDNNGNALASGVYWYSITGESGKPTTGKIILSK
ncbi:MAG: T9SS C-terminal target domain-containing protein [Sphingobacteriia bacterium]|jgi:phosphodiesterase/alkaline phosphatase D-like protein|nr:T9SS C-terminal target domain-containing protein [Candidatus Fonsibacter lacus]